MCTPRVSQHTARLHLQLLRKQIDLFSNFMVVKRSFFQKRLKLQLPQNKSRPAVTTLQDGGDIKVNFNEFRI